MSVWDAERIHWHRIACSWNDFWFADESTYTLGAIRIGFGVVVFAWAIALAPDLADFFFPSGITPRQPDGEYVLGIFYGAADYQVVVIGWCAMVLASIAMIAGYHSRIASVVVFVMVLSVEARNPYIFNSGDGLLRVLGLVLALAPSGTALSVDQRRRTGSFWSAQERVRWPIRMLQVQLTLIYVATFAVRMTGQKWPSGTAMSYALRLDDMLIVPVPQWVTHSALLMNLATWGILLGELMIGILVWNHCLRSSVLILGVVLHLGIMVTIAVGFFTPAMLLLYLAFVPPERLTKWWRRMTRRWSRLRTIRSRREFPDTGVQPSIPRV